MLLELDRICIIRFYILISHLLFCMFLLKFMMKQHIKKDLIFFFDFKAYLHLLFGKNNLRIILGSKPKVFNNIEARQEIRYSYKVSFLVS